MTAIRILVHALLRAGVIGLALLAYDALYDQLVPGTSGDADIGKGLLAFLLIAAASLAWGAYDGLRQRPLVWSLTWILVALVVGVGWEIVGTSTDSIDELELLVVVIMAQFVAPPALVGAGIAWGVAGNQRQQ